MLYDWIKSLIEISIPLLLCSLGGTFCELAGASNIALEGLLIAGAFFTALFSVLTGSLAWGLVLGLSAALCLALIFGFISIRLKANIFIAGLAVNILMYGLPPVLSSYFLFTKGAVYLGSLFPPGASLLFKNVFIVLTWALLILAGIFLKHTIAGSRLRACGIDARTVEELGLNPGNYQLAALAFSGLCCGLAGAWLTFGLEAWVPGISAGRGWIALIAVLLGGKKLSGMVPAAMLFAFAENVSNHIEGSASVSTGLILSLPYIATLAALVLYSSVRKKY
jgi:simple sugar transport system permease protein